MGLLSLHELLTQTPTDRSALAGWKQIEVPSGQALFRQGDPADQLWVLRAGRVGIMVDGVKVNDVGPGESLGEAAIFFIGEQRSAGCVAQSDVQAWVLERGALDRLREQGGELYDRMLASALAETWERVETKNRELRELAQGALPSPKPAGMLQKVWPRLKAATSAAPAGVELLRRIPVLEWATEEARAGLAARMKAHFVASDHALFLQGDDGDDVFFVATGEIGIVQESQDDAARELAVLGSGSIFGSGSFISGAKRSASAVARSDSWVFGLSRKALDAVPRLSRRALLEALLTTTHGQLRAMNRVVAEERRPEKDFEAFLKAVGRLQGWQAGDPFADITVGGPLTPSPVEAMDAEFEALCARVRESVIGRDLALATPYGRKRMIYADYTASGRCLSFIEDYLREQVMPLYANTHTEASTTGLQTTRFREEAREIVARSVGAGDEDEVVFVGSGATGGINRMVDLLGMRLPLGETESPLPKAQRPVVFIGPYEHHSNILPWRYSAADVVEVPVDEDGSIDLNVLEKALVDHADRPLRIGSFSAGSNVTGIASDVDRIARLLHRHGALSFWDYAAAGPYVPIDMNPPAEGAHKDAVFISPHKFVGGPGTPGVLVLKKALVKHAVPTQPGGGTVDFVTASETLYSDSIAHREEAGTPAIIESIRCGLVFQLKEQAGPHRIHEKEERYVRAAIECWSRNPAIRVLGSHDKERLSIVSFLIRHGRGYLHYNFIVAVLNDLFGIQARGGCSCAGPYGARLLSLGEEAGQAYLALAGEGYSACKPGWARVNFNYFISEEEFRYVVEAVQWVALHGYALMPDYQMDPRSGLWVHREGNPYRAASLRDLDLSGDRPAWPTASAGVGAEVLGRQLEEGRRILEEAVKRIPEPLPTQEFTERFEQWRWFPLPHEQAAWLRHTNGGEKAPVQSSSLLAGEAA